MLSDRNEFIANNSIENQNPTELLVKMN